MNAQYIINDRIIYDRLQGSLFLLENPQDIIQLTKPASQSFSLLIDAQHQLVPQRVFLKEIWENKGIVVSGNTFYQHIYILRSALQRLGLPKNTVSTVPREGLRIPEAITIKVRDKPQSTPPPLPVNTEPELSPELSSALLSNMPDVDDVIVRDNKEVNNVIKSKGLVGRICSPLMIVSFIVISCTVFLISINFLHKYNVFYHYFSRESISQCNLYVYPRDVPASEVINAVEKAGYSCEQRSPMAVFYAVNKATQRESVVICQLSPESRREKQCFSSYRVGYEDIQ